MFEDTYKETNTNNRLYKTPNFGTKHVNNREEWLYNNNIEQTHV